MAFWITYKPSDNTTEIYDLERVTRFRHVEKGDETQIEFWIDDNQHTVMFSIDPDAYRNIMAYVREKTHYQG
jgi:hypothetical protein